MKVFFNLRPPRGSYGGGAFFVKNLIDYLEKNNIETTFKLNSNIDIIFLIDPRKGKHKLYGIWDILKFKERNPKVKIIHRVNECDIKRKKSINIEKILLHSMNHSDKVIFVSSWLKQYYINKYNDCSKLNSKFILNGCNHNFYYPYKKGEKIKNEKLIIVTHHWSNDYLKGFEIYNKLDEKLNIRNDFELIFVGNYNKSYSPKNVKLISPKNGKELGDILRQSDIYLTATQNEPGGAHYLEGLSCGLPILFYKNGGGVKEICEPCGEEFIDIDDFFVKLELIKNNYDKYVNNINYNYLNSNRCSKEYYDIIMDQIQS